MFSLGLLCPMSLLDVDGPFPRRACQQGRLEVVEHRSRSPDALRSAVRGESPGRDCQALAPGSPAHQPGDVEQAPGPCLLSGIPPAGERFCHSQPTGFCLA